MANISFKITLLIVALMFVAVTVATKAKVYYGYGGYGGYYGGHYGKGYGYGHGYGVPTYGYAKGYVPAYHNEYGYGYY
ncbi:keratin-associated protein 19-2-like [Daphnia pulex]|uniref:keratin-associated protein 19-2-like n=1 Tax=Daphnia pulex TaxID=6669 RepID=UPI001EDEBF1C|nr:keratin-associated protein 19-2-like [Daphnia pulex]